MMQILSNTPVWVFVLFAGLLGFGLLQARDRSVKKPVAYLLPAAMVALSWYGVQSGFGLKVIPLAAWLTGLILVVVVSYRTFRQSALSFDPQQNRFFIPGSWVPLLVIMGIFFTKYAVIVQAHMGGSISLPAAAGVSLLFGGFSGYFAARALALITTATASNHPFK